MLLELPGLGVALSNAFGLGAGIFLLCFGLVTVPKLTWMKSDAQSQFNETVHLMGRRAEELEKSSKVGLWRGWEGRGIIPFYLSEPLHILCVLTELLF